MLKETVSQVWNIYQAFSSFTNWDRQRKGDSGALAHAGADDTSLNKPDVVYIVSSLMLGGFRWFVVQDRLVKGALSRRFCYISSKWLKYLTKNLFSNMKLLLEHREGNIKGLIRGRTNYKQFLTTFLQCTGGT